jgi:hypothetical protein
MRGLWKKQWSENVVDHQGETEISKLQAEGIVGGK